MATVKIYPLVLLGYLTDSVTKADWSCHGLLKHSPRYHLGYVGLLLSPIPFQCMVLFCICTKTQASLSASSHTLKRAFHFLNKFFNSGCEAFIIFICFHQFLQLYLWGPAAVLPQRLTDYYYCSQWNRILLLEYKPSSWESHFAISLLVWIDFPYEARHA